MVLSSQKHNVSYTISHRVAHLYFIGSPKAVVLSRRRLVGQKSLFRRLQVNVGIDDIGQVDAVEDIGGLVAHLKH